MAGNIAYYGGIVKDGLILDLDAAKKDSYPGSGTVWSDISGFGNNGTLLNGPTFDNANGGSIVFDGTNDFVNTNYTTIVNDITVECWYRGNKNTRNHLWNFGVGATTNLYCNFNDSGVPLWFFWNGGGTPYLWFTQGNFTDNTIKCLVFTHTGSNNEAYLNGQILTVGRATAGTQTFNNVNSGGSFNIGGNNAFGGNVYITRLYNRALSATEVLQNYNALKGRYGL